MDAVFEEIVAIPADGTTLSGQLAYPPSGRPTCAVLIMGAHPLLGGNMHNNVTTALRLGLAQRGAATLTFEYQSPRQVGGGEIDWPSLLTEFWRTNHVGYESIWRNDSGFALRYIRDTVPGRIVLIGYSFGCWSLAELAKVTEPDAFVCVSPNPAEHHLDGLRSVASPLLVITSDNDFSCPQERVKEWFQSLCGPKFLDCRTEAEHFFRGREREIVQVVADFLTAWELMEN